MSCRFPKLSRLQIAACVLLVACAATATAQSPQSLAAREESAWQAAADRIAESVVQIRTIGGLDSVAGVLLAEGPTTGVIVSPDGFVISSAFNFLQQPASILVTLSSGKQVPAELVATDHSRMLVLLKLSGVSDLSVPEIAPAAEIRPGQWAIAVGRTFRADRTNLSVGIVSAVDRMFGKVIQTDAAVSTANYGGPLVDIRGRVMGIIVPMAPQGTNEVAGVEWYDSGIGFAAPLSSIAEQLERMKKGEDLRPGILGIGIAPENPHSSPANLVAVRLDSPAGKAGLEKDDRIIQVDGTPIRTQTELRFALGPRYAGESVRLVVERGDEQIERTVELAGKLPAFRHAYLGILPMRASSDAAEEVTDSKQEEPADTQPARQGIIVRMACEGGPAADTGIRAGDRILRINETEIQSLDDALQALNNITPGEEVRVLRQSDGEPENFALIAARMSSSIPSELSPAIAAPNEADDDVDTHAAKTGRTVDLKLPEFPHECKVYIPASHDAGRPQAALLWLHAPGNANSDDVLRRWQSICDRDGVLLILPTAAEADRWKRSELRYLHRLVERVIAQYTIDPHRVVVCGQEGGGAMAWLLGLADRSLFRGIAAIAAPLPRQINVPPNEPAERLAVFAAMPPSNDAQAVQIAEGLQKLAEAGYPVSTVSLTSSQSKLSEVQRDELARWIDTLDRF